MLGTEGVLLENGVREAEWDGDRARRECGLRQLDRMEDSRGNAILRQGGVAVVPPVLFRRWPRTAPGRVGVGYVSPRPPPHTEKASFRPVVMVQSGGGGEGGSPQRGPRQSSGLQ